MNSENAFIAYLNRLGDEEAGKKYGVKPTTIISWRLGYRTPEPMKMKEIVENSPTRVTYRAIIEARKELRGGDE